ncbi:hypothetical protein [Variovorax atrisoli]|uniref:hypothetical protein n=1 Tax=Variovorax atrisoli TaxID=3394203 RepID=UPI0040403D60
MTYFTGIDVSLRSVSICVVDDRGEVCREAKVDAQAAVQPQARRQGGDEHKRREVMPRRLICAEELTET